MALRLPTVTELVDRIDEADPVLACQVSVGGGRGGWPGDQFVFKVAWQVGWGWGWGSVSMGTLQVSGEHR